MPAAKQPSLREQALQFHDNLRLIKSRNPLPKVEWYPWDSLAAMDVLDSFLKSPAALVEMIGGERVLDVGCGDGDIAFFLESLGAHVDALDHAPTNYNALEGVRALKKILGSSIRIHPADLDTRPHLPSTNYGLTLLLGVLYHLKNPFLVLEALSRHSRYLFLSTRIAVNSPDHKTHFGTLPVAYLVDDDELNKDDTNFWIFTEEGFKRIVRRCGFDVLNYTVVGDAATSDPVHPSGDARAYILAKSRRAAPPCGFRLVRGWHRLEFDSWRWTERRFVVELDLSAKLDSASLRFVFQLPEQVFAGREQIAISARVNGIPLPTQIFTTPGEHEYSGTAGTLNPGVVTVEFEMDHAIEPSDSDQRELGMLVDLSGAVPVTLS